MIRLTSSLVVQSVNVQSFAGEAPVSAGTTPSFVSQTPHELVDGCMGLYYPIYCWWLWDYATKYFSLSEPSSMGLWFSGPSRRARGRWCREGSEDNRQNGEAGGTKFPAAKVFLNLSPTFLEISMIFHVLRTSFPSQRFRWSFMFFEILFLLRDVDDLSCSSKFFSFSEMSMIFHVLRNYFCRWSPIFLGIYCERIHGSATSPLVIWR